MRVKSLIEGLNPNINYLTVITTDNALIGIYSDNINYLSVGKLFFEKLQDFINKNYFFKILPILKSILFRLFGFFALPDYTFDFYFKAHKIIKNRIDISNFDLVISTSGGLSTHLVGRKIKKNNQKIKFIMDFGDPWSTNPLPPLSYKHISFFNRILEQKCYSIASKVLVTNNSFKNELDVISFKYNFNLGIVPCGFDDPGDIIISYDSFKFSEEVIVGYIGTASSSRDFTFTIQYFKNVVTKSHKKLKFVLAGSISEHILNKVKSECVNLDSYGWISSMEAAKLQGICDILILPGNNSPNQVPGKVYSYLYSDSIIIYIGHKNLEIDPTWEILKNYIGVIRLFFNEMNNEFENELYSLINNEKLRKDISSRKKQIEQFKWDNISNQFRSEIL